MKLDSSIYKDLSKVCLDICKYVITGAILAPLLGNFEKNSVGKYLLSCGLLVVVLFLYWILDVKSKKN